jgi:transposase
VLGIDEIALKRGHKDYVVLVTVPLAIKGVKVLAVLVDRKKETVTNFFASIPSRLQRTIKSVCTDMYQGFVNAVQERVRKRELKEFESFLGTIETWLDKISNYFLSRLTSGFVEGFNNRVKVLKRRCYGIFDVAQIFQRLTLDINGYEKFGFT